MSEASAHPLAAIDGNEAAARVAHLCSEVIAIYPITPASSMGELADAWTQAGRKNLWGTIPEVIEMQSEAGAAGAVHGALQSGAMTTTFTASQGLLLMIPNLYKIAGELTPAVIHVAARSVATHALSIFGDHSDVMAIRQTGMAMLAAGSVQEAQDLALVSHAATLRTRVPFLHFFDGFRTSHEIATIDLVDQAVVRAMIDDDLVAAHRLRGLDPNRPVLRGTAQNPDVFFQAREAANPFHDSVPTAVAAEMERLAALTGRRYRLFDYYGAPDAERVVVLMGSGAGTVRDVVEARAAAGEKVGAVVVRLYRPFDTVAFDDALPATARQVAVLDRTKEPGSVGEPLYTDVVAALVERRGTGAPNVVGGRYGLSSKEFTPQMACAVLDNLDGDKPRNHFTVGIVDDVTLTSLDVDPGAWSEPEGVAQAVFYGLGSDGTVGANKNTVKILSERTDLHAQGYFVYDSKKSGAITVSHLRFGPDPIHSAYLIGGADFVACHNFGFLDKIDVLELARPGATFLLNSPYGPDEVWDHLPAEVQERIIDAGLDLWVVDADRVASEAGLGRRTNTVLQTCFFALTDVVDTNEAIDAVKEAIAKTYAKRGRVIVERNEAAVDGALAALGQVEVPATATSRRRRTPAVPDAAPDFVKRVTALMMEGKGDLLPVSALPVDGTFPTATAQWEKRSIATEIPIWDPELCIDCGRCALVCPHAAIRMKVNDRADVADAPAGYATKPWTADKSGNTVMTIQVAPDDCTGCGVCVSVCPAKSKEQVKHRAIDMTPKADHLAQERTNFDFFLSLPEHDRTQLKLETVKGSQLAQPLFEFSGACAGCGETPYLKLLSQMFGDRIVIANATGCSSIYGGNLPTTPWSANGEGRGPAWANSLFEDNAEFGLGMRSARDQHEAAAKALLVDLADELGPLAAELADADQSTEEGVAAQRQRVAGLRERLADIDRPEARRLDGLAEYLVRSGVWIVGGDGWAYDIGFGGLDHVLASGRDVNILVLDTEVYSNTGGQTSKATPRAAVAKFSAGGKPTGKKDLGMIAMAYGNVYVAQVAMGANMTQVVKAFAEAEAHDGPSLIIAYSPCIAHGFDMSEMVDQQKLATQSGYWPLFRHDPTREQRGEHALHLDSRKPTVPFRDFALRESRFAMLARSRPDVADDLLAKAQTDIDDRWHLYEQMVEVERTAAYGELDEEVHP
ncbi:MAG: pyruvate:ferredoxin (flavodoxin) oxidoreductase [Actinomycetota bacterium]|nr:pyruvate:ferredoxin (flavodoxin) oxidoreductase [Actinomycetota bacterium]